MKTIIKKTEYMIEKIKYKKINFAILINLALGSIDHNKPKFDEDKNIIAEINMDDCAKILGYSCSNKSSMKRSIDRLLNNYVKENIISIKDSTSIEINESLIKRFKTSIKRNTITIYFNNVFTNDILIKYKDDNNEVNYNRYIKYNYDMFFQCKNAYTLALYELLKLYSYKKSYNITLKDLKKYLGIYCMEGDSEEKNEEATSISYLEYKDFKKTILSPAIKYINNNTDIEVSIIKEDKVKRKCVILGKEKVFWDAEKVNFEIKVTKESNYLEEFANDVGIEIKKIRPFIKYAIDELIKFNIVVNEDEVISLFRLCKDMNLVIYSIIESASKKNTKTLIGRSYNTIERVLSNGEVEIYKKRMKLYCKDIKKKQSKKQHSELVGEDSRNKVLVDIYEEYKFFAYIVTEDDIEKMKVCLIQYNNEKIKKYIRESGKMLLKSNKNLYGFGFVKKMLDNGVFEGNKKLKIKTSVK